MTQSSFDPKDKKTLAQVLFSDFGQVSWTAHVAQPRQAASMGRERVRYVVPEDGDEFEHPNTFELETRSAEVRRRGPLFWTRKCRDGAAALRFG